MTGTDDAGAPPHGHPHSAEEEVACAMAHGELPASTGDRRLVAVFASSVAVTLAHIAAHVGYDVVVLDPDPEQPCPGLARVSDVAAAHLDQRTDVVVTDHDRAEPHWAGDVPPRSGVAAQVSCQGRMYRAQSAAAAAAARTVEPGRARLTGD